MEFKKVILRCDDGQEAIVFTKYEYKPKYIHDEIIEDIDYEICIEDSYVGGDYKGLFGRIKRACQAFINKPVTYTGIYSHDKEKMRKFLTDCLELVDNLDGADDNHFIQGLYTEDEK